MRSYLNALLDLVYPPRCPICGVLSPDALCAKCAPSLPTIRGPICGYCGRPTVISRDSCPECAGRTLHFTSARAVWAFKEPARQLIHELKYRNNKNLAGKLAKYLVPLAGTPEMITWVPLARSKKLARGYNQSQLLARHLAAYTGRPAIDLLVRVRNTADQNRLQPAERKRNVREAFAGRSLARVSGKSILLIDDVYTTGATVAECARVLRDKGVCEVHVVTLARTPSKF